MAWIEDDSSFDTSQGLADLQDTGLNLPAYGEDWAAPAAESYGPPSPGGSAWQYPSALAQQGAFAPQATGQNPLMPQQGQFNPWGAALAGAVPALGGLLGNLIGGRTDTQGPQVPTAQRAAAQGLFNQGAGLLGQYGPMFAAGQSPLQQMQMSLLQNLASGQGLPLGYQKLVEQAYQPAMGNLYQQATEQGRRQGFYDAPAASPPGGAILGPGLAQMQGQMAGDKLKLMQSLPGLYNQPIQQQGNFAAQFGGNMLNPAASMWQQQQTPALGPVLGQALGQGAAGAGQGFGIADLYNQMMTQRNQQQSQQSPYNFQQYGGMSYTPMES